MSDNTGNAARPQEVTREFISRLFRSSTTETFSDDLCRLARELTGVPFATIRVVGPEQLIFTDLTAPEDVARSYTQDVSQSNPVTSKAVPRLLREGFCRISDLLPLDQYRASEFYRDVVEPMGFLDEAAVLLHASRAGLVYLSIGQTIDNGAIDDTAYALLADARGDFATAYDIQRRLHDVSQGARDWNRIEFDGSGHILGQQGELAEHLFECGVLAATDEILAAPQAGFTRPLHELLVSNLLGLSVTDTVLHTSVGDVGLQAAERSDDDGLRFVARVGFVGEARQGFDNFLHAKYELTDREREIAYLIAQSQSQQAIGDQLFIAVDTVRTHTKRILKKTACSSQQHLSDFINRYRPRGPTQTGG
ncbi:MAG: helix-turn-helix transcriptional regulator [Pseudomonadota bacterium]